MHKRPRPTSAASAAKRSKPLPPLTVSSGEVLFRLLCPTALSGGLIGKSGSIVRTLQTATSSRIRVEESPDADFRPVLIVASKTPSKAISLSAEPEENEDVDVCEVSDAQEAAVRVVERMVEVMREEGDGTEHSVTFRLLAETSQVGGVLGKGGKVIEKIRKETGCKIRVGNVGENLPACATPNEQLMEMEGDVLAVKRALIAITGRLQECPPLETTKLGESRRYETTPYTKFPNLHAEYPPDRMPVTPPSNYPYASRGRYSTEMGRAPVLDPRTKHEEIVFRILCSRDTIGGVIGKGGTIVNALQDETGAAITAGGSVPDCDERLITITAKENPESQFSPAQNAVVLVFNRSIEAGYEKGLHSAADKIVSARVVVPAKHVGCLIGNGGAVIREMRMTTGAGIRIVEHEKLPRCATENDEVVEITGEFVNVQDALYNVTSRLRQNLFSCNNPNGHETRNNSVITEMSHYERARDPALGLHTSAYYDRARDPALGLHTSTHYERTRDPHFGLHTSAHYERVRDPALGLHTSAHYERARDPPLGLGFSPTMNLNAAFSPNMDHLRPPHIYNHPPTSMPWTPQAIGGINTGRIMDLGSGLTSVKGGTELGSGNRSAIVTNSTVEIVIPNNVIGSVYGENGSNLARLKQISGAKVDVHEPRPGTTDWTVVISGTPDETQAAQSLVQAFILTGQS